jgi:hypothetical protein
MNSSLVRIYISSYNTCAGFVSFVYICIALGDPIIKRRRVGMFLTDLTINKTVIVNNSTNINKTESIIQLISIKQ